MAKKKTETSGVKYNTSGHDRGRRYNNVSQLYDKLHDRRYGSDFAEQSTTATATTISYRLLRQKKQKVSGGYPENLPSDSYEPIHVHICFREDCLAPKTATDLLTK